jgi:hypothetical protein
MLALCTSAFVGVKSQRPNVAMYATTQKAIESGIYDPNYDFNNDGVLDDKDLLRLKKYLLGLIPLEELYLGGNY